MALHHARSGEVVDLRPLGSELREHRTSALVKTDSFEAIRLVIPAGGELPPHKVAGKLTLLCLEGNVRVGLADKTIDLATNQWLYLDGDVLHSVEGVEDSSLLLTIVFGPPQ